MKRDGVINGQLAGALARLGHMDLLVVCDSGFPIPAGPEVVDLAFTFGIPSFGTVLQGLLEELIVESAIAAKEVRQANPGSHRLLTDRFPDLTLVPHDGLKRLVDETRLVVRTGEATPYSNVILRCGVPF